MMKVSVQACLLIMCMGIFACFKPDDYDNINPDDVLTVLSGDQTVIADGVNTAEIKVKLTDGASPQRRKVTFKTTRGSFKSGAGDSVVLEANKDLEATAQLISVSTGSATVTVSIQSVSASKKPVITFTKSFPESIAVTVDSFAIKAGFQNERTLTATLSKTNGGRPSTGHRVDFAVFDAASNPVGQFLNGQSFSFTTADGRAVIRYSAGSTTYRGQLTVRASTLKEDGTTITATTQIFLID